MAIWKIFPQLCKTFSCLYSYHAYFILAHKLEKLVTENSKRSSRWSLLINCVIQSLIRDDWIIKNDLRKILSVLLEFFVKWGKNYLHCFSQPNFLPKLIEITVTCPKSVKVNSYGGAGMLILTCQNSAKWLSISGC